MQTTPAHSLLNLKLSDGWEVIQKIEKDKEIDTGGKFSVGYLVKNDKGEKGFLKALNFSKALLAPDAPRVIQAMTEAYNYERDLLEKCKGYRLRRVVTPIAYGSIKVPGNFGPLENVYYIIFEKADGDIRKQLSLLKAFDLAWCLRSMHHTATGIMQLHSKGIAHQDLKPSNVLVFKKQGSKVTDLGQATDINNASPLDDKTIVGDLGYAPIELFYGYIISDEFERRFGIDLYLLGSLFFFYFSNVSTTQAICTKLKCHVGPNRSQNNFINDLPYIRKAFNEAINDLRADMLPITKNLTDDIIIMVREMCEPDPKLRGHPKDIKMVHGNQYSLIRYVSKLDLLAKKAEYRFYE